MVRRCLYVLCREKMHPSGHLPPARQGAGCFGPRECLNHSLISSSYPRVFENGEEITDVKGGIQSRLQGAQPQLT